jgi:hypothetical protein
MARLSGDDFKAWVGAFADAFDDYGSFRTLVQIASDGKTLDAIAGTGPLENMIPAVIRKADAGGWLRRLLDEALAVQPDRQQLRDLRTDLNTLTAIEPDSPFDAMRIFGDAMFDRACLRARLRGLQTDGAPPVLVVYGDRYSGKTWSTRLISYVANKIEGVSTILVDMEPDAGKAVDAALIGRRIAEESDFENPPAPNEEQDAQWSRQYISWLSRNAKRAGGTWWIVIDHLEKVALSQTAKDFLCGLGREIPLRALKVRLVILSYPKLDELETGIGRVEYDPVPILSLDQLKKELARFFGAELLYRHRAAGLAPDMALLQAKVAASTDAVLTSWAADDPRRLVKMAEALHDELKRIAP